MISVPMPSMSAAPRLAQWPRRSSACAGQLDVRAAHGDLARLAPGGAAAAGAVRRRGPLGGAGRAHAEHRADDLGDHVAGLAHDDGVADAHVLAAHLVLVVQRGARDRRAGDGHRVELRERREHAGAADLHADLAQHGRLLLGRELVGDRPARRLARVAELVLQRERVDLHHDAVDLVGQRVALLERARRRTRGPPRGPRTRSRRGSRGSRRRAATRAPRSDGRARARAGRRSRT